VSQCVSSRHEREGGIALLLVIMMLLLVSALGIAALNRAGDEMSEGSSSRRQVRNLAAAEAGLKLVGAQLAAAQAGSAPPSTPIYVTDFVTESGGLSTQVRTGRLTDTTAQPITPVGTAAASGGDLRVGYGAAPRLIYRVNVVATDPSGGNVQLQAQFSVKQN